MLKRNVFPETAAKPAFGSEIDHALVGDRAEFVCTNVCSSFSGASAMFLPEMNAQFTELMPPPANRARAVELVECFCFS